MQNHLAEVVDEANERLLESFEDKYREVFKIVTADNGSEFANLFRLEENND